MKTYNLTVTELREHRGRVCPHACHARRAPVGIAVHTSANFRVSLSKQGA